MSQPLRIATAALLVASLAAGCKPDPLPGEPNATTAVTTGPAEGAAASAAPDPVLLDIDGTVVTLGDFERRAARLSELSELRLNTTQGRSGLLEMFVWLELLARTAEQEGLVGTAEEILLVEEARARTLLDNHAAGTVNREALSERLPEYYAERKESDFTSPERRRIYGIVFDDPETARAVRREIIAALDHVRPVHVFGRLAGVYSTHQASREDEGRMGWITRPEDGGTADPILADAVFAMPEPGLGPVVQTTRGWEVFFVAAIEPAVERSLQDVEAYLADVQYREALAADARGQLDEHRAALGVEVDAGAVAALAAARHDEPESATRPRRFSVEALAGDPAVELGYGTVDAINEDRATLLDNPRTRPMDPPAFPLEGSGEEVPATP